MTLRPFALVVLIFGAGALAAGCARTAGRTAAGTATARATFGDGSRGAEVFRANCAVCHTAAGAAGGVGPSLEREKARKSYDQTVAWIESPDPPMPKLYPATLSEKDVQDVAAYVQSL